MSIFGEERKIKFTKNGTTILIDHCVILRSEPEPKTIMHESIINRHREWIDIYDHHIVECIAYLCKYADPNAAYQNFLQYEGELVDSVFEYIDGEPLHDENNTAVRFWLDKIKPMYINTDEYPDELRFTFKSEKTVVQNVYKIPSDIPDLWLWFNDDTLTNPSGNLFRWVDKVTGDIILSGNYGAGSGLTPVNGKNVLNTSSEGNTADQLNIDFYLPSEMTFIGVIHSNFATSGNLSVHVMQQLGYPFSARYRFYLTSHGYNVGDDYWVGLKFSAPNGFSPLFDIGYADSPPKNSSHIPYVPTFFSFSYNTIPNEGVTLNLNTVNDSDDVLVPVDDRIVTMILNETFQGNIYEFMFYNRKLTTTEINDLKKYYKAKYGITTDIGIV